MKVSDGDWGDDRRPARVSSAEPEMLGDAGIVFAASTDGYVYAVQEENGSTLWRFSTGDPILQTPAVIDNRVYVTTELGTMYCLAIKTGKNLWSAQDVVQFVAASKSRVYATDRVGRLLVSMPTAAPGLTPSPPKTQRSNYLMPTRTASIWPTTAG